MSFKGITWAGNVYEKFEAMCLEVEEAMYQDTVKYVENQVQKVGVSVKKFYSEVMEDLSPLSCVDPMSLASDDLSLNPHGHRDVNKKPIPSILDNRRGPKKKENEEQVISSVTAEKGSSQSGYDVNLISPQSPGILIENKSSEKCAASKKIGVHRRPIGIKRISRNNHPSKDSRQITSVSEDGRSKVANCDMRTSSRLASDNTDVASSTDFDGRCEPGEAVNGNAPSLDNPIESPTSNKKLTSKSVRKDTSRVACDDTNVTSSSDIGMQEPGEAVKGNTPFCECPASEKVSSAEPMRQIKDVSDCISLASDNNLSDESVRLKGDPESASSCSGSPTESTGASVDDISFSALGSSTRSNVCNLEYDENGVTVSNEDTSVKDGSSSAGSTPYDTESCNQDPTMPPMKGYLKKNDSFDIEFVENDVVAEPSLENFETSESVKLEESCILVEGDELHCALQGTRKHKSYKKRIREALSSKLKSRKDDPFGGEKKKQEMSVRDHAVNSEKQKLSVHDSVESDWELL
ncbi:hypothetical protein C2S53_016483 [Perilla frutescens var. hirtella]|uniref:Uncharacterized protein n=1 Tax=Perilla frutescens var. hirtella TaxID=608512 RepID=A0AAD4PDK6_PERFH|nr:hypothetical protein C2S53_016483 [Perilla frutescens var. hirtella]